MKPLDNFSFLKLTKTEQIILVLKSGEKLMTRCNKEFSIHLYLLGNLFVELWYEADSPKIVKTQLLSEENVISDFAITCEMIQKLRTTRKTMD
ncbi:MAG: hypothetical protein WC341_00225 [Bacteroidales bacterium]|jgi:hypothetical protein